jgi:hypothetical protein
MAGENNDLISGLGAPGTVQLAGNLKLVSTTKSVVFANMTSTQRDAIAAPEKGLTIFNTTSNKLNVYTGSAWEAVTSA